MLAAQQPSQSIHVVKNSTPEHPDVATSSVPETYVRIAYDRGFNDGVTNRSFQNGYYDQEQQKVAYKRGYEKGKYVRKQGTHWYMNTGNPVEKFTDMAGWSVSRAIGMLKQGAFESCDQYTHGNTLYSAWYHPGTTQCITLLIRDDRISETFVGMCCGGYE